MLEKNEDSVIINGKAITIHSLDSIEYHQRIANYINGKIEEFSKFDSYRFQSDEVKNLLIQINLADDYLKALDKIEFLENELTNRTNEAKELKHDLISAQMRLDSSKEQVANLQQRVSEKATQIAKLQQQIKSSRDNENG